MEKYGVEIAEKSNDNIKIAENICEHPEKDKRVEEGTVYCVKCQKYIDIGELDD